MFKSRRDHNFRIFKELIKHNFIGSTRISNHNQFPYCLVVRIPGSHPGGPGSIPGMGISFTFAASSNVFLNLGIAL